MLLLSSDINLFSTTLRYARTNEVCSINNSSIAASRIINCNRSPSAIVFLDRVTHISILDGDNLKLFRESLESYVRDHPRIWDSLAFIRIENIDTNFEQVKFSIAVRHRNSWQDAGRILLNRADLLQYVYDTLKGEKHLSFMCLFVALSVLSRRFVSRIGRCLRHAAAAPVALLRWSIGGR